MELALEKLVRSRAYERCEYCHLPQSTSKLKFPIDHIIARQHGGAAVAENLALCCGRCNLSKGPNIAGIDPVSVELTPLFNPRTQQWSAHFRHDGAIITGLTAVGRTTVYVLGMNERIRVAVRESLIEEGIELA